MWLDLFQYIFWGAVLLWLALAVGSLWLWGGAKRNALGQISAGMLYVVSGSLFIYVAVINIYARMDNAYLGNGLFGFALIVVGVTLLVGSLAGYGVPWWGALACWLAVAALYWFGTPAIERVYPARGGNILGFGAFVIVAVLAYILARRFGWDVFIALVLAGVGIALVWLVYGAGFDVFTPVDTIGPDPILKPPVLDIWPFAFCVLAGAAVFLGGRSLQTLLRKPRQAQ